ncbi:MAG: hypothetical protein P8048_12865, partial [Calditrichia bacterium]
MKKTLFYFLFYFSFWSLLSFYQPLYAQALDPLLPDFVINDFSGNIKPQQMNPWVSSNRRGRSVIAWIDKRELKPAIYAQIFAEDSAPVGPNIRLTGDSVFDVIKTPAGAMDNEGNFVVTWIGIKDRFHAKDNVYFRRFLSDGSPAGSTILVHNLDGDICAFPDIVMNPGGGFVITWEGPTYYCGLDVLAQRFSKDGIPLGNNFRVADDTTKEVVQEIPSISGDNQGNFVISWIGTNKSTFGTYAQLFS